ncbi:MAG: DUF58 domain-containing protein, partial [Flavobacteriales bacterium]
MEDALKHIKPEFLHEFGSLDFIAKSIVEGFMSGMHKSPYQGFSVEFSEHRIYNPGDSMRHIDWKRFAKTDKLYIKKYEADTNLECRFILDGSASMFFPIQKQWSIEQPNKYLFSTYAIASLIQLLRKQRDASGLSILGEALDYHSETKNTEAHQYKLFKALEDQLVDFDIKKPKGTQFPDLFQELTIPIKKRSVFIVFSDLIFDQESDYQKFYDTLEFLKDQGHEVLIFHCLDHKTELDFNFQDEAIELHALEQKSTVQLSKSDVQTAYQNKAKEWIDKLKTSILERNCSYIPI